MTAAVCVDVGSTYTKACRIDLATGEMTGRVEVPTTAASDVLQGLDAAVTAVTGDKTDLLYVCSSAGGGLRLAVVGYESLVTAEAGHRVGRAPTDDNLLVFYLPGKAEWAAAVARLRDAGHRPVEAFNPYWDRSGLTFEDPDGYRVVLQNERWDPE